MNTEINIIRRQFTSDEVNEHIERIAKADATIASGKKEKNQVRAELRNSFDNFCSTVNADGQKQYDRTKLTALTDHYEEAIRQCRNDEAEAKKHLNQTAKDRFGYWYEVDDVARTYSETRKERRYLRQCVRVLHEMADSCDFQEDFSSSVSNDNERQGFIPSHSYRDYVVGDANRLAYEALKNQAEGKIHTVCIFGESGTGKTHLVHAHGDSMLSSEKGYRICHIDCEDFEVAFDSWAGTQDDFIRKYCTSDFLIVENVDVLAGKHGCQKVLAEIAGVYQDIGDPVVFTIKRYADYIPGITSRLLDCLGYELVVQIELPDHALKSEILARLTEADGIRLDGHLKRIILGERNLNELIEQYKSMRNLQEFLNRKSTIHDLRALAKTDIESKTINMKGGN